MSFHVRSRWPVGLFLFVGLVALAMTHGAAPSPVASDVLGDPLPPGALVRYGTVRLRHNGLSMVTFTSDGKRLLSFGGNNNMDLRLWDVRSGKLLDRRRLPQDGGEQMILAPDGGIYLLAHNGVSHIKDFRAAKRKLYSQDDLNPARGTVCPDGKMLAISQGDGSGLVLDLPEGKVKMRLAQAGAGAPFDMPGGDLAFSRDGKLLAQSSMAGQIVLWDMVGRKQVHTYGEAGGAGKVRHDGGAVQFSPDGKHLLVHGGGQQLRLYPTANTTEVAGFRSPADPIMAVRFSEDSKELIAIDHMGKMSRYEATTGKDISSTPLPIRGREGVHQATFSPDGKSVAVVENASIYVVDIKTGKLAHEQLPNREPLRSVRRLRGKEVMSVSFSNQIHYWDARTGKHLRTQVFGDDEMLTEVDPEGKRALVQSGEQPPKMIQLPDKKELWKLEGVMSVVGAQFSPDGRWLVTTSESGVDIRDSRTGKTKRSWPSEPGMVPNFVSLAWSPSCRMLAQIDMLEDKVTIHEFGTGQVRYTLKTPDPASVTFCSKGQHVAVASADGVVRVYKLGRAEVLFEVVVRGGSGGAVPFALAGGIGIPGGGLAGGVLAGFSSCVTFSPDSKLLVAACSQDIRVWDMTGKPVGIFRGHDDQIIDLNFASDGRTLASASSDGTALIWDMGYLEKPRSIPVEAAVAESLWADLASEDGTRAYRAMSQLQEKPALAVALLGSKLLPSKPIDAKAVGRLIEELDSDEARVRKLSVSALEAFDVQVEVELTKALEKTRSAEVRRAIGRLLARLDGATVDGDRLREIRAVEVLETIASPPSRAILARLAMGADSRQTREAKEALARLATKAER